MTYLIRSTKEVEPLVSEGQLSPAHKAALGLDGGAVVALLDAAAHHQVPEMLNGDTETASCLWQGAAQDALGEHAPWLAVLDENSATLRSLITKGDAPWHLWGRWPGLLIQARKGLPSLRHHLRRLSRVTDNPGNAYFLRFWEPSVAQAFWAAFADNADHVAWRFGSEVAAVMWQSDAGIERVELAAPMERRPVLTNAISAYRPLFKVARWNRFVERVAKELAEEGPPFDTLSFDDVARLCEDARGSGYRKEIAIWDAVRAIASLHSAGCDIQSEAAQLWQDHRPADDRSAARELLEHARGVARKREGQSYGAGL
ncbi:DUF4123 domain-containing protein [Yoonia sp. SDW83-1]|uniref:DUF4123 domain-containing protein n=1 Tax=Yoonia sp. SDW83-1 TaxID=3366945 RepID=UPI00398C6CA1